MLDIHEMAVERRIKNRAEEEAERFPRIKERFHCEICEEDVSPTHGKATGHTIKMFFECPDCHDDLHETVESAYNCHAKYQIGE